MDKRDLPSFEKIKSMPNNTRSKKTEKMLTPNACTWQPDWLPGNRRTRRIHTNFSLGLPRSQQITLTKHQHIAMGSSLIHVKMIFLHTNKCFRSKRHKYLPLSLRKQVFFRRCTAQGKSIFLSSMPSSCFIGNHSKGLLVHKP